MKIYFENGRLLPKDKLNFCPDYYCDAGDGYSNCEKFLWNNRDNSELVIYTNFLEALSSSYAWNEEIKDHDIFIREDIGSQFKRISDVYGDKLRVAQNIVAMYRSGCFGCI